ncbi:MAG: acyltransferase [Rhodospirillaceae bacterium]|nr:acyltransferase [Rhodospirillaceae bacterium]
MHDPTTALRYRPDIDGLRAVAVLPVVFYHLGTRYTSGGFIGVDVFFVISGYLITGLIATRIAAGTYSVVDFYVRRARRIFPALFVMFGLCALFALGFVLSSDLAAFGDSLAAASLFVSNIYFYLTTDYFALDRQMQPLLHTWSLAVEEQFYIFFPLILMAIHRYAAGAEKAALATLAVLSFAISVWLVQTDAAAGFYLLHARAWELVLGALLAIRAVPPVSSRRLADALGLIGLLLIAGSVLLYTDETPFPGVAALAPCIGTALVIHSGAAGTSIVARALSIGAVRFVGLISYSLYLWHWPVIVFGQYLALWYGWNPEAKPHKLAALILSLAFAAFSWQVVEKPFRQGALRFGRPATLAGSAAIMAMLVAVAGVIQPLSARLWPIPAEEREMLAVQDTKASVYMRLGTCFLDGSYEFSQFDRAGCLQMAGNRPNVLLLGDSQAADLRLGLGTVNPDINFLQATASGCKPIGDLHGRPGCTALMRFMIEEFIPAHRLDAILLAGRWRPSDLAQLRATAEKLKPHADRLIVLGPRLEYRSNLPWILAVSALRQDPGMLDRLQVGQQKDTDRALRHQFEGSGIHYFSLYRAICSEGTCRQLDERGTPLSFDYGHFTESGSIFVARQLRQAGLLDARAPQARSN